MERWASSSSMRTPGPSPRAGTHPLDPSLLDDQRRLIADDRTFLVNELSQGFGQARYARMGFSIIKAPLQAALAQPAIDLPRPPPIPQRLAGSRHECPGVVKRHHKVAVGSHVREDRAQGVVNRRMQPIPWIVVHADGLRHEHPRGLEDASDGGVELPREEQLARSPLNGIGDVIDNDIESLLSVFHKRARIAIVNVYPRIIERARMP